MKALPSEALGLVRLCKEHSKKLGMVTMLDPSVCIKFLIQKVFEISNIIKETKIIPDTINVEVVSHQFYPDLNPEPLINYRMRLKKELNNLKLGNFTRNYL